MLCRTIIHSVCVYDFIWYILNRDACYWKISRRPAYDITQLHGLKSLTDCGKIQLAVPWYQIYNGLFGRYTLTFAWRTHPLSICLLRLSAYLSVVPALYCSPRLQRLYMTHYIFKRYKYFFSSTVLLHGESYQFRTRIFWTTLMLTAAKEKCPHSCLRQDYTAFQHTSVFSLHRVYFWPLDTVEGP